MPLLPIPNRCIWCTRTSNEVAFDLSHVLPECVGNRRQQVLLPGIVCKQCNSYFGTKIEPALLEDPIFHVIAAFLQLVDAGDRHLFRNRIFDANHPSVGTPNQHLNLDLKLNGQVIELGVTTTLRGHIRHEYSTRELAFLSRAVHKIAFESLAWQTYVAEKFQPPPSVQVFDPLSGKFDNLRGWARGGQPMVPVRPVVRRPATEISGDWKVRLWDFGAEGFGCELMLFGDWYAVNLTSPASEVIDRLRGSVNSSAQDIWYISDKLSPLNPESARSTA